VGQRVRGSAATVRARETAAASTPSEGEVVCLWQRQAMGGAVLRTSCAEPVEILYPGRTNEGHGADFRDAVVAIGGRLLKGDIEVHVRSSDWEAHGHHRDAAYDRVVLHVVMRHDRRGATGLRGGGSAPVVALDRCAVVNTGGRSGHRGCSGAAWGGDTDRLVGFLESAGESRFLARAEDLIREMGRVGAAQCLYRGVMGALGYAHNKAPFLELAERVPLDALETAARGTATEEERLARLQSRLVGTAGLLPSQRWGRERRDRLDDACVARLEGLWASQGNTEVMPPSAWDLFRVRPHNSPVRRLVAMSHLICRYRERGLLDGLVGGLTAGCPHLVARRRLEEGLVVTARGYWANRSDFGWSSRIRSAALLGRRRAADIVVNVLLPFAVGWSRSAGRPGIASTALDVYRHYPRLETNALERHMRAQLGVAEGLVDCARRQQGLLHIYKTRCTQGRCAKCELRRSSGRGQRRERMWLPSLTRA